MLRSFLLRRLRPYLDKHSYFREAAVQLEMGAGLVQHSVASVLPIVIRPTPRRLTIAITASCNYACVGCRYGRDFMPGHYLKLNMVRTLLDDAAAAGMTTVRFYGGEPLVHPDLAEMIRHANNAGILPYITTNGYLLDRKIDKLYAAGLRIATLGYYGWGSAYDEYTSRAGAFEHLCKGLAAVRSHCGKDFKLQLNFLLMRRSCSLEELHRAWDLARTHDMTIQVDLVHYSLPYFTEGPNRVLQFTAADEQVIRRFTEELLRLKSSEPGRIPESETSIKSIPDWLLKGPAMRVPCDAYEMIWVGADGTVQLCYVTFPIGNLHQARLRELLYNDAHKAAAKGCFRLECPNCHCERNTRIAKHLPSRLHYSH
ncbi:MAG: radical SAM protein [Acidobacteriaceae bacterium]|nr:radical SAM protein [Acidobacteriaceae bacterium]MBV8572772.1 radical SAM protein [Acidobacteriaceae bacterium]